MSNLHTNHAHEKVGNEGSVRSHELRARLQHMCQGLSRVSKRRGWLVHLFAHRRIGMQADNFSSCWSCGRLHIAVLCGSTEEASAMLLRRIKGPHQL